MPIATIAARITLGLVFLGYGLNGVLHFLPMPSMGPSATQFVGGLVAAGYFFPLLFVTYAATGAALLTGRFVPLALIVLAPIVLNIVAIHLLVEPSVEGLLLATVVLGLELFLAWSHRATFAPLLRAHAGAAPVPVSEISNER